MKRQKFYSCLLNLVLLLSILPCFSFGQGIIGGNYLGMTMVPENPEPFQLVKITLNSPSYDLNRSKITWLIDGVAKKTEIGLKEFNTKTGKNGQKTVVKAIVETPQDGIKEIEAFFIPSVVDLIYESQSYTPPFYKGKALNPAQGIVRVIAIPELIKSTGEKIPAEQVVYTWKRNGKVDQSSSGVGKNTLTFNGTIPIRDSLVEVIASSLSGDIYTAKQINITTADPKIIFYENSPVYGFMSNKAIKAGVKMLADEFSVTAAPYFFSASYATSPDLDYTWTLNDQIVPTQEPKNYFTTRVEKAGSGTANIGLKITNNNRIFQSGSNNYLINFSKE